MTHSACNKKGVEIWMRLTLSKLEVVTKLTVWPTHLENTNKWRFNGTKVYVEAPERGEVYCGDVTIPESDQTSSDIICEVPLVGNAVVFRLQKEEFACIHVFEVEAYFEISKYL